MKRKLCVRTDFGIIVYLLGEFGNKKRVCREFKNSSLYDEVQKLDLEPDSY